MQILDLIAAAVRGDRSAAAALVRLDPAEVCRIADEHGMLPLLAEALAEAAPGPSAVRLAEAVRPATLLDMIREPALRELIAAFDRAGVPVLLMKGVALAYTHYARPDLRPRIDTDVLIRATDRGRADAVLRQQGYRPAVQVSGALVTSQAAYAREEDDVTVHAVDLHWQAANPQVFAGVLTFEDAATRAVPVPVLGPAARVLGDVDALLLACTHRVAHHGASDRLIWIYDVHLLASRLRDDGWSAMLALADSRGVALICRRGLEDAAKWFGTAVPFRVWDDPRLDAASHEHEATAAFLAGTKGQWRIFLSDVSALSNWRDRAHLMREHLFPSADYMKGVYAPASRAPLAWLYARRVWRGARKWLVRG